MRSRARPASFRALAVAAEAEAGDLDESAEQLSFALAAQVELAPEMKQELLELRSEQRRLESSPRRSTASGRSSSRRATRRAREEERQPADLVEDGLLLELEQRLDLAMREERHYVFEVPRFSGRSR